MAKRIIFRILGTNGLPKEDKFHRRKNSVFILLTNNEANRGMFYYSPQVIGVVLYNFTDFSCQPTIREMMKMGIFDRIQSSTCWRWCVTHRNVQIKKNDLYHHLHHFPKHIFISGREEAAPSGSRPTKWDYKAMAGPVIRLSGALIWYSARNTATQLTIIITLCFASNFTWMYEEI